MLRQEKWMDIKGLKAQGYSQRAVARMLGLHRDTVRRVWKESAPRRYTRGARASKLDGYVEHLRSRLEAYPGLRATRLYREVRAQGFTGGYECVKRFCRAFRRSQRSREATVRFETPPGHQAQVDWGESRRVAFATGEIVKRYYFTIVLAFSRLRFVVYLPAVTQAWLLWAHVRAFEYFGGVPQQLLYDNPKSLVNRPRPHLEWQPQLLAFASHYGYVPQACWPRRPQTKGKVEQSVGYHERDFLLGLEPQPKDDAELNQRALEWCDEVAERVCAATGVTPRERCLEERGYLGPLPQLAFDCRPVETRRVLRDAVISYGGNRYSVPAGLVGTRVTVKEDFDRSLRVYADNDEVAVHPLLIGRGQRSIVPEHHAELWAALKQLPEGYRKRTGADALMSPSVSLWKPRRVEVERRSLDIYAAVAGEVLR